MESAIESSRVRRSPWIDAIRGAALLAIGFDHLSPFLPQFMGWRAYTFQLLGIVSMAELFLLTSGAAVSNAYLLRVGALRRHRIWRRAWRIYLVHLATLAFVLVVSSLPGGSFKELPPNVEFNPLRSFALGSVLLFQPSLVDILPLYVVLFLALPFLLESIERGRWRAIAAGSMLLWLCAQLFAVLPYQRYYFGAMFPAFNVLAWQAPFVLGIFAFHPTLNTPLREMRAERQKALLVFCGIALTAFFLARHLDPSLSDTLAFWSNRPRLGPLRMANLIFLLLFAILLQPHLPERYAPRFLQLLGRHSLWLWAFHIVMFTLWVRIFEYHLCSWSGTAQSLVCFGTLAANFPLALLIERAQKTGSPRESRA